MSKKPIEIILGREVSKGAPGMLGRGFTFKPGHSIHTRVWFYPGEPFEEGSVGARLGLKQETWDFWTGADIDFSLIFDAEDVREVIIPNDPETLKIFEGAPFKVTIKT